MPVPTTLGLMAEALELSRDEVGMPWLGVLGVLQRACGSRTGELPEISGSWVDTEEVLHLIAGSAFLGLNARDLGAAGIMQPEGAPTVVEVTPGGEVVWSFGPGYDSNGKAVWLLRAGCYGSARHY